MSTSVDDQISVEETIDILRITHDMLSLWDWKIEHENHIEAMWMRVAAQMSTKGLYSPREWRAYQSRVQDALAKYNVHRKGGAREDFVEVHEYLARNLLATSLETNLRMLRNHQEEKTTGLINQEERTATMDSMFQSFKEDFMAEMTHFRNEVVGILEAAAQIQHNGHQEVFEGSGG